MDEFSTASLYQEFDQLNRSNRMIANTSPLSIGDPRIGNNATRMAFIANLIRARSEPTTN